MSFMSDQAKQNFYLTTPIYYVNAQPHLGHAYTTVLCDFIKREHQAMGDNSYFLTGTDEHGDKIAKSAEAQKTTPQEFVDKVSQSFRDLLPKISAENNDFIRTTDKRHKDVVTQILQKVYDQGDIYFGEYDGKYCRGCEAFFTDNELEEGKCPIHQQEPEVISEKNYFFKMSKYWDQLKEHIEKNPEFITPAGYRNEVIGMLKQDPTDLCISRPRSRLTWGVELPFDKEYVTYVWFDALINYISALGYPDGQLFKDYWPVSHNVIAKDILKPHCIYWPTMLMSMGASLPNKVCVHGYWLINEAKMSKSFGTKVDPLEYCDKYGTDIFRYYLLRGMRFGKDASFSHQDFVNMCNADLANNIGNLYSRIITLCNKYFDGALPPMNVLTAEDIEIKTQAEKLPGEVKSYINSWEHHKALESIFGLSDQINKYFGAQEPWKVIKEDNGKERVSTILRVSLEGIRLCFSWLWPAMPDKVSTIIKEIGLSVETQDLSQTAHSWDQLETNFQLPKKPVRFERIES